MRSRWSILFSDFVVGLWETKSGRGSLIRTLVYGKVTKNKDLIHGVPLEKPLEQHDSWKDAEKNAHIRGGQKSKDTVDAGLLSNAFEQLPLLFLAINDR